MISLNSPSEKEWQNPFQPTFKGTRLVLTVDSPWNMPEKFKTLDTPEHGIPFILCSVRARGDPLRWQKIQSTFPPEQAGLPTKWFHNSKVCFALAP